MEHKRCSRSYNIAYDTHRCMSKLCHLSLSVNNTSILGQSHASSLPCKQRKRGNQMESGFFGLFNNPTQQQHYMLAQDREMDRLKEL